LEEIIVVSLFDGMSCGQIAFESLGFKVKNYYASEIKSHAIKVTKENYPDTIHIGDVTKVHYKNKTLYTENGNFYLGDYKIALIGGSPCKGISRLNKNQDGLKHPESKLFWHYIRIKNEINPSFYLLENTHGNKEATDTITETLGKKPYSINARLVSAQNRPRYYWTNLEGIEQPQDLGITTKDIIKDDIKREEVSNSRNKWLKNKSGQSSISKGYTKVNPYPKAGCLTALGHKKWNCNYVFKDGKYYYYTQEELEMLQSIPKGYTKCLTYEEAYDVLGDGWNVEVIKHILSYYKKILKEENNE